MNVTASSPLTQPTACLPRTVLLVLAGLSCLVAGPILKAAAQTRVATDAQAPAQLYLLAATPSQIYEHPPATSLYTIGAHLRLRLARQIIPPDQANIELQASGDAIYILKTGDAAAAETLTVLHKSNPLTEDEISLPSQGMGAFMQDTGTADPPHGKRVFLLPLAQPQGFNETLLTIRENPDEEEPRVRTGDDWDLYRNITFDGVGTGELNQGIPGTEVVGAELFYWWDGNLRNHPVPLASAPPEYASHTANVPMRFYASNDKYLIVGRDTTKAMFKKRQSPAQPLVLDVFHRDTGRWAVVRTEGFWGVRLFYSWLTINVEFLNPGHKVSPGVSFERGETSSPLPPVRDLFDQNVSRNLFFVPGILLLYNLEDGRRLRIVTHHEDSEILSVGSDTVVYRVDNAIYQATIAKDTLQAVKLLVRDDDVPEIHWAFWSSVRKPSTR